MPATKRAVVGALVGAGGLLVTVALVGLTATSSAALPAAIGFASVEKAVQPRFAIKPDVTSTYWSIVHATTKYAIVDLVPTSSGSLEFSLVATADDADLVGEQSSAWEHMLGQLPRDDCRYGLFDFTYTMPDGSVTDKVVLATSRMCANNPREQMDTTYGITDLLNAFPTIDVSFMAKTQDELDYATMLLRVEACALRDEGCVGSSKFFSPPQTAYH
ncbi:hypothetical protein KFE25_014237 [Diacronema lutheri]|uniref:ADF-H domain-containing protein n=1 Tax=Diacronema lutheri TaxID=2081491 RepID=A0A8J5XAZ9_DIALT|nr:hypothetical protein KFE25_014237 [Diacronema lutheri]